MESRRPKKKEKINTIHMKSVRRMENIIFHLKVMKKYRIV